ncbi:MAG: ferrous iron transporter B [Treponemataceae bacterium]
MEKIKIALAGNPNAGKTTLFNALTGANQFVGNWPGVTVEKKEGKLKKHDNVIVTDLPGIYSLSPYTLEEVVARNYLINESPDAILNIVDGSNLERNLYLTTQLLELGIPTVVAINMMDVVRKTGDKIDVKELERQLGCKVIEISALKGEGVMDAAKLAIEAAKADEKIPQHVFIGPVEHAIAHIEEAVLHEMDERKQRWFAIKIFERDEKILKQMAIQSDILAHIETDIKAAEKEIDDDAESIIINERYVRIAEILKSSYKKATRGKLSASDKIDKVVTNRWAALPIFAAVMFLVYFVSITTVGTWCTDWTNDCLFGDGWFMFGKGREAYDDAVNEFAVNNIWTEDVINTVNDAVEQGVTGADELAGSIEEGDYGAFEEAYGFYGPELAESGFDISETVDSAMEAEDFPDPSDNFGWWVPGIPALLSMGLEAVNCAEWLESLIVEGIVGGVGAVLGFVPQMLVLFIFLAFLEGCGYMARVAFIMDRIFRKFGLSGKSFIPMLIGTGCGVPGIMASRTIENPRDRRMTIMTTTFIPCGAKLPIIALIAVSMFGGAAWVGPSAYFVGVAAIIVSGIMLKKTKMFEGDTSPFVMELPAYHWPTFGSVMRSMWERGWSFIKKAGTIILISSIVIWAGSKFGWMEEGFGFNTELELGDSILGKIGYGLKWIFMPLGFGNETATVATIMGLVAKEEVVGVFGVLDFKGLESSLAAYSFLLFNLLCAPCFAAIGAMKREFNSHKWLWFAIGYQCGFAYIISLIVYQLGCAFTGRINIVGLIFALLILACLLYLLFRPARKNTVKKAR